MTDMPVRELRKLYRVDPKTGDLFFLPRDPSAFKTVAAYKAFCTRNCGKKTSDKLSHYGYKVVGVLGKKYLAHRVVYALIHGHWPKGQIDHINGNRADNRIENLRDVSPAENQMNMMLRAGSKSGVSGVCAHSDGRWRVHIRCQKGNFDRVYDTLEEAKAVAKEVHKRFGYHPNHGRKRRIHRKAAEACEARADLHFMDKRAGR